MGLQLLAEAPLEALVFRYPAAAGGSLWTWLAVLAAALGLWRFRSAAASPKPEPTLRPSSKHTAPAYDDSGHNPQQQQEQPQKPEARPPAVDGGDVCFTPKGTVFQLRSCHVEKEEDDSGVEEWEEPKAEEEEQAAEERRWEEEEGSVIAGGCVDWRWRGDLGWYRYQDMAALNGKVVRLWEDEKGIAPAPVGSRRLQVAW